MLLTTAARTTRTLLAKGSAFRRPSTRTFSSRDAPAAPSSEELALSADLTSKDAWWSSCRASSLTGSEMYCLGKVGLHPNQYVLGSSSTSMGVVNGFLSTLSSIRGEENKQIGELIQGCRNRALEHMQKEARHRGGLGIVGTRMQLVHKTSHIEVLVSGTTVKSAELERAAVRGRKDIFTVGCTGEQLYCLLDSGFEPNSLVFGTEAYSRGLSGFISGAVSSTLLSGHVPGIFPLLRGNSECSTLFLPTVT